MEQEHRRTNEIQATGHTAQSNGMRTFVDNEANRNCCSERERRPELRRGDARQYDSGNQRRANTHKKRASTQGSRHGSEGSGGTSSIHRPTTTNYARHHAQREAAHERNKH